MKTFNQYISEQSEEANQPADDNQLQKALMMNGTIEFQGMIEQSDDIQEQLKLLAKMNVMLMSQIMISSEGSQS